jgi:hypothetical protein
MHIELRVATEDAVLPSPKEFTSLVTDDLAVLDDNLARVASVGSSGSLHR